jgi:hypothetical protein
VNTTSRRFQPPWSVDETGACFLVRDANGHAPPKGGEAMSSSPNLGNPSKPDNWREVWRIGTHLMTRDDSMHRRQHRQAFAVRLPSRFADARHVAMKAFWRLSEAKTKDDWLKALAEWNRAPHRGPEIKTGGGVPRPVSPALSGGKPPIRCCGLIARCLICSQISDLESQFSVVPVLAKLVKLTPSVCAPCRCPG